MKTLKICMPICISLFFCFGTYFAKLCYLQAAAESLSRTNTYWSIPHAYTTCSPDRSLRQKGLQTQPEPRGGKVNEKKSRHFELLLCPCRMGSCRGVARTSEADRWSDRLSQCRHDHQRQQVLFSRVCGASRRRFVPLREARVALHFG